MWAFTAQYPAPSHFFIRLSKQTGYYLHALKAKTLTLLQLSPSTAAARAEADTDAALQISSHMSSNWCETPRCPFKHHDGYTHACVLTRSQLSDRNAGDISSRRRKVSVSTCNTVQPCRQDAFQGRAAFCVEFEMTGDRVQPCHRWSYYSAFLGFSFPYPLMTTNALLSYGNTASIYNLGFHPAWMLRIWVPEDIYWSVVCQIYKLFL